MRKVTTYFLFIIICACSVLEARNARPVIPVYFSDNHGGSFYFIADNVDYRKKYTLLLFDMHSDARSIPNSDFMREVLLSSTYDNVYPVFTSWNERGIVQCYNWIEPLLPAPIDKVIWVPSQSLTASEKHTLKEKVRRLINAETHSYAREVEDLSPVYSILSFEELKKTDLGSKPVICSIDLDYCARLSSKEGDKSLDRIYEFISGSNLHILTHAISQPYLKNMRQGHLLLYRALRNSLNIINSRIVFDPHYNVSDDRSDLATAHTKNNIITSYYSIYNSPPLLQSLIVNNIHRLNIPDGNPALQRTVSIWEKKYSRAKISINGISAESSFLAREKYTLALSKSTYPVTRVSWKSQSPVHDSYNLSGHDLFAKGAPSVVYMKDRLLKTGTDTTLQQNEIQQLFDPVLHCGTVRIFAEIEYGDSDVVRSNMLTISQRSGNSYTGKISELMNQPYIFGSSYMLNRKDISNNKNWGTECTTFLIYGMDVSAEKKPYNDPFYFDKNLNTAYTGISLKQGLVYSSGKPVMLQKENIENGVILDLGMHFAAVYKDKEPYGTLDLSDHVVHHLETYPQLTSLKNLLKTRYLRSVMLVPKIERNWNNAKKSEKTVLDKNNDESIDIIICGDIMLGRSIPARLDKGFRPFKNIQHILKDADLAVANLEYVATDSGTPRVQKQYLFKAPVSTLGYIKNAGIDAVSIANNHSGDYGIESFTNMLKNLTNNDLKYFGGGVNEKAAYSPLICKVGDYRIALIAFTYVETPDMCAKEDKAGIAWWNDTQIIYAIKAANDQADFTIVMPHWGREYTSDITSEQYKLAKRMARYGADAIIGTHSHHVQKQEYIGSTYVVYSTGNFVFDGIGPPGFNNGAAVLLQLSYNTNEKSLQIKNKELIPFSITKEGLVYPR
ncbi:MAG: CapA family protein [Spirochaetes bacterium]|nr:CapA family protein [Spirochaetota bacterium]